MALLNNQSMNSSSHHGENLTVQMNVLASCYIADSAAQLKGTHYCTAPATDVLQLTDPKGLGGIPEVPTSGFPSPPTSPPLAALTSSNELALLPKKKSDNRGLSRPERRGGAALMIREECERFFCETMKTVFRVERNLSMDGSCLTGAYLQTPPPDNHFLDNFTSDARPGSHGFQVEAWIELWDYAGGASFRAFMAGDSRQKSLFVFFDMEGVLGRELKKALMALIELADGPLECSHIVTCVDRRMPTQETLELTKSLQWVGFEIITLDRWAQDLDVTSSNWMFMGMEI